MDQIKKQASSFLQDKYRSARMVFSDVTEAEVLTEEATNGDVNSPDAKTMTRIAEASYHIDDYWRIVDVLHKRLDCVHWKKWRESYKSLIVLEFLLTHGPEDFAEEFMCDIDAIKDLGSFRYIDDSGFNWGVNMLSKSKEILKLLVGGKDALKEARFRALRISKEIQGFGSSLFVSPFSPSLSSSSSSSSDSLTTSSMGRLSTNGIYGLPSSHEDRWNDHSNQENKGFFLDQWKDNKADNSDDHYYGKSSRDGFVGGIFSKLTSFTTP